MIFNIHRRGPLAPSAKGLIFIFVLAAVLSGCAKKEAEVEPVVSVQVQPAKRATISEVVSTEAVVYPVEQAVITPKNIRQRYPNSELVGEGVIRVHSYGL